MGGRNHNKLKTELLAAYRELRIAVQKPSVHDLCAVLHMTAQRLAALSLLPMSTVRNELCGLQTGNDAHEAMVAAFRRHGCIDLTIEVIAWGTRESLAPGRPVLADLCELLGWTMSTLYKQGQFSRQALYNEYSGDYLNPRVQKQIFEMFQAAGLDIQSVYDIDWDPKHQRPVTRKKRERVIALIAFPPELMEHIEKRRNGRGYQEYFDALAQRDLTQVTFSRGQSVSSTTWHKIRFGIFPEVEKKIRDMYLTRQDFFETLVRYDLKSATVSQRGE